MLATRRTLMFRIYIKLTMSLLSFVYIIYQKKADLSNTVANYKRLTVLIYYNNTIKNLTENLITFH
ncbi:hypothetical protein SAMN04488048_1531 [Trichococcus flocculiformis]|nr:hypothetical protein SAMN04488048_1531 [Trichococcus flocculiformis]